MVRVRCLSAATFIRKRHLIRLDRIMHHQIAHPTYEDVSLR